MFEFLASSHVVNLVHEFMDKWNVKDEQMELRNKRLSREYDEKRKKAQIQKFEDAAAEEEEKGRLMTEKIEADAEYRGERARLAEKPVEKVAPTIAQIAEGTGLKHEQVAEALQSMKDAEDQFVHWPHPQDPGMTRVMLRQHAEEYEPGWQPGSGI